MFLNFPSEAFKVREQEVSSPANMLDAVGEDMPAQICEEVHGLASWVGKGVSTEEEDIGNLP
jgi:hypothetical protein